MSTVKPRKMIVNVAIRDGDTLRYRWDDVENIFALAVERDGKIVSAEAIDTIQYYERPAKPKFLSTIRTRRSRDFSVSQAETIQRYAQVWAIDDSSDTAFGVTFNVAALCALEPSGSGGIERVGAMLFGKTADNPERYGWRRWIEFILPTTQANERYAIIVDSEFSRLPAMNDRTVPLHGDFMLPENFDIIYATDAATGDQLVNQAMKACDTLSKAMRRSMQSRGNAKYFADIADEEAHVPIVIFCSQAARQP